LHVSNNTLNISRAFLGESLAREPGAASLKDRRVLRGPVEQELCKAGFRGLAVLHVSNNMLNISRAFLGESLAHEPGAASLKDRRVLRGPVEQELCKNGFRGHAVLPSSNNTLNVSRAFLGAPLNRNFVKLGSGGTPCCRLPTTRSMFRVLSWAPR
jgi:hypothetical protein